MLQTIGFSGARQIDAEANFFRYESGDAQGATTAIRVQADGQDLGVFLPGDDVQIEGRATRWLVTPITITCAGTIRIGRGRVTSSRSVGTVEVIDGERNKVLQGVTFVHPLTQNGAGTGPAIAQMFNPTGSGRNAYVNRIISSATAADTYRVQMTTTQAALAANAPVNLDPTGAASVVIGRTQNNGAALAGLRAIHVGNLPASQDVLIEFPRPVLVRPGWGLHVTLQGTVADLRANFEFEEWPA